MSTMSDPNKCGDISLFLEALQERDQCKCHFKSCSILSFLGFFLQPEHRPPLYLWVKNNIKNANIEDCAELWDVYTMTSVLGITVFCFNCT